MELRNKHIIDDIEKFKRDYYPVEVDWTGPGVYYGKHKDKLAACKCCYAPVYVLISPEEYKQELIEYSYILNKEIGDISRE